MAHMFSGASQFNQDIGKWDVKTTTGVWEMLHGANSFDRDVSRWRVAQKLEVQAEGLFYGIARLSLLAERIDIRADRWYFVT